MVTNVLKMIFGTKHERDVKRALPVVAADRLTPRALELARRIAENAPTAVQTAKQLVDDAGGEGFATTLESLAAGLTASTEDAREGIAAFRAKRKPDYTGQ